MIGQCQTGHSRVCQVGTVALTVAGHQLVLGRPVQLRGHTLRLLEADRLQTPLPQVQRGGVQVGQLHVTCNVVAQPLKVLGLHLHRRDGTAVDAFQERTSAQVVTGVPDSAHGVGQSQVAQVSAAFQVVKEQVHGRHLEQGGSLGDVGVSDDDVHAPVALGVGVGLVPGVDQWPGTGRG